MSDRLHYERQFDSALFLGERVDVFHRRYLGEGEGEGEAVCGSTAPDPDDADFPSHIQVLLLERTLKDVPVPLAPLCRTCVLIANRGVN